MPRQLDREYFETIPDDEPVFILRAQDKIASVIVEYWLELAYDFGVKAEKLVKVKDKHLIPMIRFSQNNPSKMKIPD